MKNRCILVSGGGSGLGAATALHLANLGAKVVILDCNYAKAAAVAQQCQGLAIDTDISHEFSVKTAIEQAVKHWQSTPEAVVNCAGIGEAARIINKEHQLSTSTFIRVLQINLIGTYYVMSYAVKHMMLADARDKDGSRGVIINTSSIAAEDGQVGQAAYAASKAGIAALNLPAARELKRFGIRVVSIAPGLFQTPLMDGLSQEVIDGITQNITFPMRFGKPDEYAYLVEHIINNSYLNGTNIRLDGAARLPAN